MIRTLNSWDTEKIFRIVNLSAKAYEGRIPRDCYHEPYMSREELIREMRSMTLFGWMENGRLVGVMGYQPVKDVTLIRHAYILPEFQRLGIGLKLLEHMRKLTKTKMLLVGTWADAWAVEFYKKHGFKLMPSKDELLNKYWDISRRKIETSVVLGCELS